VLRIDPSVDLPKKNELPDRKYEETKKNQWYEDQVPGTLSTFRSFLDTLKIPSGSEFSENRIICLLHSLSLTLKSAVAFSHPLDFIVRCCLHFRLFDS
jgi:hypothetical protein